jgi:hypothetical protein
VTNSDPSTRGTGQIYINGVYQGGAVALGRRQVVTAAHVLSKTAPDDTEFRLEGATYNVVDVDSTVGSGLAVLTLDRDVPEVARVGRATPGTQFQITNRPGPSDPVLTGTIVDVHTQYRFADGSQRGAVQLVLDNVLGNYDAYSGSAVIAGPGTQVIGILIEQARGGVRKPANMLIAASLADVVEQLGYPEAEHVPASVLVDAPSPATVSADGPGLTSGFRRVDFSNDGGETDLVGIGSDVDTLSIMIASPQTVPPLSIGLFGPWGSGKSFFMRRIEDRVTALAKASSAAVAGGRPSSFCRRIVHIRFNAWLHRGEPLGQPRLTRLRGSRRLHPDPRA